MSKLDEILERTPADSQQFMQRIPQTKQQIKDLIIAVIGTNEPIKPFDSWERKAQISVRNDLKNYQRQKVEAL